MGPARLRIVGIAFIVATLGITVIAFSGLFRKPFEPGTRTVTVDFAHAAQLHAGDQVRIRGDIDGKVTSIKPSPVREAARVKLAVDKSAGPIYADASARLNEKTLLGGAFYVDLERGTPTAGELGDKVIGVDRTTVQTEIEDVTDIFRQDAVTGMQTLPKELGTALSDPSKPADALRTANDVAKDAATAVYAARGQEPGQDIPDLVASTARAVRALDTPDDDVRAVVSGAAATLATTGRRAAEIEQTIAAAPGATDDLTHTLARLDGTLGIARTLVHKLDKGVPQVAPTLAALRPTLPLTTQTLRNARPLLLEVGHTANAAGQFGKQGSPLIDEVDPSLRRLNNTILPYLGRKDPIDGYSTTVMTGGFFAGFAGVGSAMDSLGHYVRFAASVGDKSVYLPCNSTLIDATASGLLACDGLNTALKNYLSYFPPAPGSSAAARKGAAK